MAARSTRVRELVAAAVDHGALPPRPGPELDGYLDATERCVRRYGWSRTSAQDIAREAGVNRTTIYRVLGAKAEIFRLLADRQAHRLIEQAVQRGAAVRDSGAPAAEAIIELAAAAIEQVRHNPTIAKLLADEPELVASFMRTGIPEVLDRFTRVLGPRLGAAMARGVVARRASSCPQDAPGILPRALVWQPRVRGEDQGRDEGHRALFPAQSRRSAGVHPLRFRRKARLLRASVLAGG